MFQKVFFNSVAKEANCSKQLAKENWSVNDGISSRVKLKAGAERKEEASLCWHYFLNPTFDYRLTLLIIIKL